MKAIHHNSNAMQGQHQCTVVAASTSAVATSKLWKLQQRSLGSAAMAVAMQWVVQHQQMQSGAGRKKKWLWSNNQPAVKARASITIRVMQVKCLLLVCSCGCIGDSCCRTASLRQKSTSHRRIQIYFYIIISQWWLQQLWHPQQVTNNHCHVTSSVAQWRWCSSICHTVSDGIRRNQQNVASNNQMVVTAAAPVHGNKSCIALAEASVTVTMQREQQQKTQISRITTINHMQWGWQHHCCVVAHWGTATKTGKWQYL